MRELKGKTAFITGGASGLGLGIAKACAAEGMNVVVADMRQSAIDETVALFKENNWPVLGLQLNVTDREAYEKAADEAEKVFGNIHLLVNNAGLGSDALPLWEVSYVDTDLMVSINFVGVLNGIRVIVPRMLKHGEESHVVSTASMSGLIPTPRFGLYNATKAGVIAAMESLAIDLDGTNIGVSVFCPGPHNTTFGNSTSAIRKELAPDEPYTVYEGDGNVPERTPENAGLRVVRGIKRGDLYILTHREPREGFEKKAAAISRAFPEEVFNREFFEEYQMVCENPVYDKQTPVPALGNITEG